MQKLRPIPVRCYSSKELADAYGVSKKVISKWLQPIRHKIGKREGWYFNIKQIRLIFDHLGRPNGIEDM